MTDFRSFRRVRRALAGPLLGLSAIAATAAPASALSIQVTVENLIPTPGIALTPVYFGFHDDGVDLFDAGQPASTALEVLAELGDFGPLRDARLAVQPGSAGGVAGPPPIQPGQSAGFTREIDPATQFRASFFSMIVPTNDTFIAVDLPLELFAGDVFVGADLLIGADGVYDAGTEDNDPTNGPAFVEGVDATLGAVTAGGVVELESDLQGLFDSLEGLVTVVGETVVAPDVSAPGFAIARIRIEAVDVPGAEVPLPAAAPLLLGGLGLIGVMARRRASA
ncbi:MAG: spondin domain-containing protein [Pseudomonadota bacterium]